MQRIGEIVAIRNNLVEVICLPGNPNLCSSCTRNCSETKINLLVEVPDFFLKDLTIGSKVVIEVPDKDVLKISSILFLLPTVFIFVGISLGIKYGLDNPKLLIIFIISLISGLSVSILINKFHKVKPKILRFYGEG